MYKFRIVEAPDNMPEKIHPEFESDELHAKIEAERVCRETHSMVFLERDAGDGFKRANRRYVWWLDHVCFY